MMRTWSRRFGILFVVCDIVVARAFGQTTTTAPPPPVQTQSSPTLFGANFDLEGSSRDKGATVGAGSAPEDDTVPATTSSPEPGPPKRRGEFTFAPIPLINPSIGNGGGAGVLYTMRLAEHDASPPSSFGLAGFGTGSGSWGLGLGGRFYLKNDRYRILAGGGGGEFNYNFFGVGSAAGASGISIPLSQRSRAFLVEPKMRVFARWYLGPR